MADKIKASLLRIASIKSHVSALNGEKETLESGLVDLFHENGIKTQDASFAGREVHGTLVEPERVVTDYDALLDRLTPAQRKSIVREVVDKDLLEAAVALGKISAEDVAAVSEVKTTKPYIKVSGDPIAPGWYPPERRRATPRRR